MLIKLKTFTLLFLLSCFFHQVIASKNVADSLKNEIKITTDAQKSGELKYQLAKQYISTSFDSSLYYTEQVINHAEMTEQKKLLAKSYFLKGYLLHLDEDFGGAVKYYLTAKLIYQELGDLVFREKLLDNVIAIANQNGAGQVALHYNEERLKLIDQIGDCRTKADIYFDMGLTYKNKEWLTEANKMFFKAKTLYELESNPSDSKIYAKFLNTIGANQYDLAYDLRDEKYLDSALYYYHKSLQIDQSNLNKAKNLNNIGNVYLAKGLLDKAYTMFHQSLVLMKLIGSERLALIAHNNLGRIHFKQGNLDSASYYFNESLEQNIIKKSTERNRKDFEMRLVFYQQNEVKLSLAYLDSIKAINPVVSYDRADEPLKAYYKGQLEKDKARREIINNQILKENLISYKKEIALEKARKAREHFLLNSFLSLVILSLAGVLIRKEFRKYRKRNKLIKLRKEMTERFNLNEFNKE